MAEKKAKPFTEWSTEDLEAERDRLAEERTKVRLAQNEVAAELEIRQALSNMSPETRRVIELRLGGEVAPAGETAEVKS